jgi:hypothetical protein
MGCRSRRMRGGGKIDTNIELFEQKDKICYDTFHDSMENAQTVMNDAEKGARAELDACRDTIAKNNNGVLS